MPERGHRAMPTRRATAAFVALVTVLLMGALPAIALGAADRPAAPAATAPTVVDELQGGFTPAGSGWRDGEGGYGDHHYWIVATKQRNAGVGTWRATLPEAGRYRIQAMVPQRHATTRAARYVIRTAEGTATRVANQYQARGSWMSLGTHALGATVSVRLTARTGDPAGTRRMVAFDALRFVPVVDPAPRPPVIRDIVIVPARTSAVVTFSLDAKGPARVEYRAAGATAWLLGGQDLTADTADHRFVISGLQPATDYELRILATNAGGTTISPILPFTTTAPPPPVISKIVVVPDETRVVVTFSLDAKGPASTEYRPVGTTTWTLGASETSSDYADHRQVIGGLRRETAYELRILATNAGGTTISDIQPFTTLARTA